MQKNKPKSRSAGKLKAARKSNAQTEIRQKNQAAPEPVSPVAGRLGTQPTVGTSNRQGTQSTVHTAGKPEPQPTIRNTKLQDSGCKVIFEDNTLCAQFLRDYIDLPCMKDIQPGDIEDVSAQFVPLIAEERDADRVKRVHIRGEEPFFLISLVEHKTKIDYNVDYQKRILCF